MSEMNIGREMDFLIEELLYPEERITREQQILDYSSNSYAVRVLLLKLVEDGHAPLLNYHAKKDSLTPWEGWHCYADQELFYTVIEDKDIGHGYGKTMSEAICRAIISLYSYLKEKQEAVHV